MPCAQKTSALKIGIAIATTGRPHVLYESLQDLRLQSRVPDLVAICPADQSDIHEDRNAELGLPIHYMRGARGASAQRNAIIERLSDVDVVVFMDDDFSMTSDYLAEVERLFGAHDDIVIATGDLIADDVNGPGLAIETTRDLLAKAPVPTAETLVDIFNGYGCNMAVRWSSICWSGARFDEALPLYSWGEDVDFSRQLSGKGRIVRSNMLRGVHRATKHGRTRGVRFGYSQIANQAYLLRKGTVPVGASLWQAVKNIAANAVGSVKPEPHIDRRGRLLGNTIGLYDLFRGRSSPSRILDL